MKKIEAIIRVEKFEAVKEALNSCNCPGVTTTPVEGHGRQKGIEEQFRGTTFRVEFIPKLKLEIVVSDDSADKIVNIIMENATTGEIGDGKIFILPVSDVIRIRTKERGDGAL